MSKNSKSINDSLNAKDIKDIIKLGAKLGVKSISISDLDIHYNTQDKESQVIKVKNLSEARSQEIDEESAQEDLDYIESMELQTLDLEDPSEYERQLLKGNIKQEVANA